MQPDPVLAPPDPKLAAARLLERFGPEKAREVAKGYVMGQMDAGDLEGAAAWVRVVDLIEGVAEANDRL
jgi:hypothetical protein